MQNWKRFSLGFVVLASASGCSNTPYFPLSKGTEWTYSVNTGLLKKIVRVKINRMVSADGKQASLLSSSMGNSVLFWNGDSLMASELSGTRFKPPLLMLKSGNKDATGKWEGMIDALQYKGPARAELTQQIANFNVPGKKSESIETILKLTFGDELLEVRTVFTKGLGIAQQEQSLNGKFVSSLDHVSGP